MLSTLAEDIAEILEEDFPEVTASGPYVFVVLESGISLSVWLRDENEALVEMELVSVDEGSPAMTLAYAIKDEILKHKDESGL